MPPHDVRQLLADVRKEMLPFGYDFEAPSSTESLARLQKQFIDRFGWKLPSDYVDFLATFDGFEWNGFRLYGSERHPIVGAPHAQLDGVYEVNVECLPFESFANKLMIGSDSLNVFVYDFSESEYLALSKVSHDVGGRFNTIWDLLREKLPQIRLQP